MIVYIKNHSSYAGKWIYQGYFNAWKHLGYEPKFYDRLEEIDTNSDYYLMTLEALINSNNISILEKSIKTFLFVQPTKFQLPWGSHPNFISSIDKSLIPQINKLSNVTKWSFLNQNNYFSDWENYKTIPLAFDNFSYSEFEEKQNFSFDVCFIGGRANNGFDEKYHIMLEVFECFRNSDLKCGFFIDRGLTHEQEKNIIYSSKIAINIHDAYQRKLGFDTNERTFKSLGINGILVSDAVKQIGDLFPDIKLANNSSEYVQLCKNYLNLSDKELQNIKEKNKNTVLNSHTYVSRVKQLLGYL